LAASDSQNGLEERVANPPQSGSAVFGSRDELVLGIEDEELSVLAGGYHALDDHSHAQPDAREPWTTQPSHDQISGSVDQGGFDETAALARVDPDVVHHSGSATAPARLKLGDMHGIADGRAPGAQVLCPRFLRRYCKLLQTIKQTGHNRQVWQYRRAGKASRELP